jgi:hypothetical protein
VTFLNHVARSKISSSAFSGCSTSLVIVNPPLVNDIPTGEPTEAPNLSGNSSTGQHTYPVQENGYHLCYSGSSSSDCCHQKVKVVYLASGTNQIDDKIKSCTSLEEIVISEGFAGITSSAFAGNHHYLFLRFYHYHHYLLQSRLYLSP